MTPTRRPPWSWTRPRRWPISPGLINGIGVAPDYYIPRTAQDLATGRYPDIAKALALLKA